MGLEEGGRERCHLNLVSILLQEAGFQEAKLHEPALPVSLVFENTYEQCPGSKLTRNLVQMLEILGCSRSKT